MPHAVADPEHAAREPHRAAPAARHPLRSAWVYMAAFVGLVLPVMLISRNLLNPGGLPVDEPLTTAADIARLSLESTKYLVSLTTAVLGLLGLLAAQKLPSLKAPLGARERWAFGFGAVLLGLSLWAGFTAHHVAVAAAADGIVRASVPRMLWLQRLQVFELGLGVFFIGIPMLWLWLGADRTDTEATHAHSATAPGE